MQSDQRIVTQIPLTELWDASGVLPLERGGDVGSGQIADLLRSGPVQFVLADLGKPLSWVPLDDCYRFWKGDWKLHLIEPDAWDHVVLEDYPGEYGYRGTEWRRGSERGVIVLEKLH